MKGGRIKTKDTKAVGIGILGKVKIGDKAVSERNGKEYPISLDHFRFTSDQQSRVERMMKLVGEKPTRIPITFHCNDVGYICNQQYELRNSAGQLVARGDGLSFEESRAEGFYQIPEMEKQTAEKYMADLARETGTEWKETLTLRFMVMGSSDFGLWEFRTGGKDTSIQQIIASFDTVMEHAGRVAGMPFWLEVKKHKSNRANTKRQYPVVSLVCDLSPEMVERVSGVQIKGLVTAQKLNNALPTGEVDEMPPYEEQPPLKGDVTMTITEKKEAPKVLPMLQRASEKFDKAVEYFFNDCGGKIEAIEKVLQLDKKAKEYFVNLEYWMAEVEAGNADDKTLLANNIEPQHLKHFGFVEHEEVPV